MFRFFVVVKTSCLALFSGTHVSLYGKQRLWGSVGWGIFSLLTGTLIDLFSEGAYKDYTIAFILMFVFMCGDVIVSAFIKVRRYNIPLYSVQLHLEQWLGDIITIRVSSGFRS